MGKASQKTQMTRLSHCIQLFLLSQTKTLLWFWTSAVRCTYLTSDSPWYVSFSHGITSALHHSATPEAWWFAGASVPRKPYSLNVWMILYIYNMYIYIYAMIYIYIYTHTIIYIYTHTHISTYISKGLRPCLRPRRERVGGKPSLPVRDDIACFMSLFFTSRSTQKSSPPMADDVDLLTAWKWRRAFTCHSPAAVSWRLRAHPRPTCQCLALLSDTSGKLAAEEDGLRMPSTFLNSKSRACFFHTHFFVFFHPSFPLPFASFFCFLPAFCLLSLAFCFCSCSYCFSLFHPCLFRQPLASQADSFGPIWNGKARLVMSSLTGSSLLSAGVGGYNMRIYAVIICINLFYFFMNLFWTCIRSCSTAVIQFPTISNVHVPKFQNFQSPWRRLKSNCGCQLVSPPAFLISIWCHCW